MCTPPNEVRAENAAIVLTTYTLLHLDFDHYQKLDWSILFLDEAQNVNHLKTQTYGHVRRLRAPVKIPVTGTPLENNLEELWSLLSIAAPGLSRREDRHAARADQRRSPGGRLLTIRVIPPQVRCSAGG